MAVIACGRFGGLLFSTQQGTKSFPTVVELHGSRTRLVYRVCYKHTHRQTTPLLRALNALSRSYLLVRLRLLLRVQPAFWPTFIQFKAI
jgi:hypothetical protein